MVQITDPVPEPKRIRRSAVPTSKLSAEALLISAVINTGDVGAFTTFGITPEHMRAYSKQLVWITSYADKYGECPTPDAFRTVFKEFPLADHEDVRSAADLVLKAYYKHLGKDTIQQAAELFGQDNVQEAATLLQRFQVRETVPKGNNLVTDASFLDVYLDEEARGIPFPWEPVQSASSGIHPGNLVYLAARPGNGKSSYATEIACNAVQHGYKVKYYSLEMSEMEMRYKVHARLARELSFSNITVQRLRDRHVDRDEYKKLLEAISEQEIWEEFDVHTPRNGMVTPLRVMSDAEEYDLVVIDLVSLMANNRGQQAITDWRVAAEISNELKQIALSTKTPILGTVQINRDGATGEAAPHLHQLSQSDSYGQDGDIVCTFRTASNIVTRWSIEKARFGTGSRFVTRFDPDTMHFPVIDHNEVTRLMADADDD